mgnify:CR=1 FL=1
MLNHADMMAWVVTLKLALVTTLILLVLGTPIAWWLSRTHWRYKFVLEALIALPLVLPPTVLGFYLLLTLGPNGPIGGALQWFGGDSLAFTFSGLVVGSVLYSFPFVVQPLQNAFTAVGLRPLEAAATLGASRWDQFWSIVVPMTRPAFLTAMVLGFAHTVGEFGVVLMIGGNIPGETQVLSIAIYEHVEGLEYENAHWLAGGLLLLSFSVLSIVYCLNRRFRGVWI